jgi:hypothetical protein
MISLLGFIFGKDLHPIIRYSLLFAGIFLLTYRIRKVYLESKQSNQLSEGFNSAGSRLVFKNSISTSLNI